MKLSGAPADLHAPIKKKIPKSPTIRILNFYIQALENLY